MAKYVTTDSNGLPTGFYDTAVNGAPPAGAQQITLAQYQALLAAPLTTTFIAGTLGSFTPAAVVLSVTQEAYAALSAGLAVTCTGSSGVNGTYGLGTTTMSLAADLAALITDNGGAFPGSVSTWSWPDITGALHTIPSAAVFLELWKVLAAYRLALMGLVWANTGSLPAATVTIA